MSFSHSQWIGVAYKPTHFHDVLADLESVDFFEVHAENYLGAGGAPHRQLRALSDLKPLTIHGVGLSLGGISAPDPHHLERLRQLLQRYPAQVFSEHLAWSSHGNFWLPDLLPLAYDDAAFIRVADHIDAAQSALGRRLLIENPSTYLALGDPLSEADFLNALHRQTGCGFLLDISNVAVSCHNHSADPQAYLLRLDLNAVHQIHLAGHSSLALDDGSELHIDDHGSAPSEQVMALYEGVLLRSGPRPTLIEWDNDVPEWKILAGALARTRETALGALARRKVA